MTAVQKIFVGFLSSRIVEIVHDSVQGALGTSVGQSELALWRNFSKTAAEGKS